MAGEIAQMQAVLCRPRVRQPAMSLSQPTSVSRSPFLLLISLDRGLHLCLLKAIQGQPNDRQFRCRLV
ncbi:hypothetical protein J6590_036299 [Homalodisca vitripennis]|nr:hypothetical protein J6590_036299 [Homalodisca vitripennis]